jgi:hypothetical protein
MQYPAPCLRARFSPAPEPAALASANPAANNRGTSILSPQLIVGQVYLELRGNAAPLLGEMAAQEYLLPASAHAAAPCTSNPPRDCKSWPHRTAHTEYPYSQLSLSRTRRSENAIRPPTPRNTSRLTQADAVCNLWQTKCLHGKVFALQCGCRSEQARRQCPRGCFSANNIRPAKKR